MKEHGFSAVARRLLCGALSLLAVPAFCATMDARVRRVPADLAERVFEEPAEALPALVRTLTGGMSDQSAKVKVLHDWICDNIAYDTDLFSPGGVGEQDYETVLRKRRGICAGYTNLMSAMCYYAGIEAVGVSGWLKGWRYPGYLRENPDHAWNAIKVGGSWKLVDVTLDAGYVDYRTFIKRYTTEWLFRTPSQFIWSHLPQDEDYQFITPKRTPEQFVAEPYVRGAFFDYGLAFAKDVPGYSVRIDGAHEYAFTVSKNTEVDADVALRDEREVPHATWLERSGSTVRVSFDVPDAEPYRLRILARTPGALRNPDYYPISRFETRVLPAADQLLAEGQISEEERDLLVQSYYKVEENGFYYFAEDLFDTRRNAAVTKVLKLAGLNTDIRETVLYVDVAAAEGYEGYGKTERRFPSPYTDYMEARNTSVISPRQGVLTEGATETFRVRTQDFARLGLLVGDELIPFEKNPRTGEFELEAVVPSGQETLKVYGQKSRNATYAVSLWYYLIEPAE